MTTHDFLVVWVKCINPLFISDRIVKKLSSLLMNRHATESNALSKSTSKSKSLMLGGGGGGRGGGGVGL